MKTVRFPLGALALALAASSCDVAPDQAGDRPPPQTGGVPAVHAPLVTSLRHPAGTRFDFFETRKGAVLVVEAGSYPVTPAPLAPGADADPVALHRFLAPGREVPARLLAAASRAEKKRALAPAAGAQERAQAELQPLEARFVDFIGAAPDSGGTELDHKCPQDWFSATFCRGKKGDSCLLRKTGEVYWKKYDLDQVSVAACSYRGSLSVEFTHWDCRAFCPGEIVEIQPISAGEWVHQVVFKATSGWDFHMKYSAFAGTGGFHQATSIDK